MASFRSFFLIALLIGLSNAKSLNVFTRNGELEGEEQPASTKIMPDNDPFDRAQRIQVRLNLRGATFDESPMSSTDPRSQPEEAPPALPSTTTTTTRLPTPVVDENSNDPFEDND
jgi:hypothetical protein